MEFGTSEVCMNLEKCAKSYRRSKGLNIDISNSDTTWLSAGSFLTSNGITYFSGNDDQHDRYGVVVAVSKRITYYVIKFSPVSDRILLLHLQTKPRNLILYYAPTAEKTIMKTF